MALHNKYDKETLKKQIEAEEFERMTISFYQYANIKDVVAFRDELYAKWDQLSIKGRTYVSAEGINAQISVPEPHFEQFKEELYAYPFLDGVRLNIAVEHDDEAFYKLKIKVRYKIVADGIEDEDFDATKSGQHVNAEKFNELTDQEDTILIDMRNHYESEVGHFEGAVLPDVDTFRDSLPIIEDMLEDKKEQNIVMYCTGGIRCEKASAFLKHKGFENVYQLEGGIIKYAHDVEEKGLKNKFVGKNFVFDSRLGERISEEIISECHQCDSKCDDHTNCANDACHLLFIQCKSCAEQFEGCCSQECQDFIHLPLEKQIELRKGLNNGQKIYHKGRSSRLRPKLSEEFKSNSKTD